MGEYEPMAASKEGAVVWWEEFGGSPSDPSDLPSKVFRQLKGGELLTKESRWYPSRQHALQALAMTMAKANT